MFRESILSILKRTRASQDHNSILRSVFVCAALAAALWLTWSNIPTSAASAAENKINAEVLRKIQDLTNQMRSLRLSGKVTADNMAQFCIDAEKADKIATQIEALIEPLKQEHNEKLSPGLIKMEAGAKEIHEGHSKVVQECAKKNHLWNEGAQRYFAKQNGKRLTPATLRKRGVVSNGNPKPAA